MDSYYDSENDALLFDFGRGPSTFDLPEGDGRIVWAINNNTGSVAGFCILGAKTLGVSQLRIDLTGRIEKIRCGLRNCPEAVALGRAPKALIDMVTVSADSYTAESSRRHSALDEAFGQALAKFQANIAESEAQGLPAR
jgi:hypothetical protein